MTDEHDHDPGSGIGLDDAADTGIDLRPRTAPDGSPVPVRRRRHPFAWVVLGLVVVGLGFVVLNGLSGATLYFRNADEAVAQRDDLGTRRFRIQGLVVDEPVIDGEVATFEIAYNDVVVPVRLTQGIPDEFAETLTRDAAFPKRMGRPDEYAVLAVAIVESAMFNGSCIRLDGGQRFAPK